MTKHPIFHGKNWYQLNGVGEKSSLNAVMVFFVWGRVACWVKVGRVFGRKHEALKFWFPSKNTWPHL